MRCKINLDTMYREWCVYTEGNPICVFTGTYDQCKKYVSENKLVEDNNLTWR